MTLDTGISAHTQAAITEVLARFPCVREAVLYGSRAMGCYRAGSDIDLSLKGSSDIALSINRIAMQLDDLLLPWQIDLSSYDTIDNSDLIDHINRVGVLFYERKTDED